ncbi:hypothetical protein OKW21_005610 [Catalinimonas alkaloidigena]|uniref:DUF547 domain-containing protein n=1 Tax=Catalinimonas alkaloidigena TaxID=1075417 RepID=UPI002406FFE3|nr:DUF547 domain-containing protein [Catalinimonas alkaloidigena]MDF9800347.1 hypothetical protein [Catalinimonas alkaloidigena]
MKKSLCLLIIFGCTVTNMQAGIDYQSFLQETDSFMRLWANDGKVDYQRIQNHFELIETLYLAIGQVEVSKLTAEETKAFYLNAYNLIVIHQISKYYPLSSPLDHEGFFDREKHLVAGESMTLNHLEIMKIMIPYRDPRIHFALSSAAVSCPRLANFAYLPQKLDEQLDQRIRLSLNNENFIKIDHESRIILISRIFAWYKNDFTYHGKSLKVFINQYRSAKLPENYALDYSEYYWALNAKEVVGR